MKRSMRTLIALLLAVLMMSSLAATAFAEENETKYPAGQFFTDGEVHKRFNPYETPYEAFINYMNVLSDFIIRVNNAIAEKQ